MMAHRHDHFLFKSEPMLVGMGLSIMAMHFGLLRVKTGWTAQLTLTHFMVRIAA